MCVHACMPHAHATACLCSSENNLEVFWFFPSGNQNQATRLGDKRFYRLSHLTGQVYHLFYYTCSFIIIAGKRTLLSSVLVWLIKGM